jgi:hypothetical protein
MHPLIAPPIYFQQWPFSEGVFRSKTRHPTANYASQSAGQRTNLSCSQTTTNHVPAYTHSVHPPLQV